MAVFNIEKKSHISTTVGRATEDLPAVHKKASTVTQYTKNISKRMNVQRGWSRSIGIADTQEPASFKR